MVAAICACVVVIKRPSRAVTERQSFTLGVPAMQMLALASRLPFLHHEVRSQGWAVLLGHCLLLFLASPVHCTAPPPTCQNCCVGDLLGPGFAGSRGWVGVLEKQLSETQVVLRGQRAGTSYLFICL